MESCAVYPRWRGEHVVLFFITNAGRGLSPLARGTHRYVSGGAKGYRFIPAGAGNTKFNFNEQRWQAVYPRWRGEHPALAAQVKISLGLSPLARGTRPDIHGL